MNDCVMRNKNALIPDHCTGLKVTACPDQCRFYRNARSATDSLRRSNERLASLPFDQQVRIAEIYYNKQLPWLRAQEG